MGANVICLQETHMTSANAPVLKLSKFQKQFSASGLSKSRGVTILLANSLRFGCTQVESDPLGRYIFIKGLLGEQFYTFGSI